MEFKIITLNCWGIPFVSKDRKDRIEAIGEALYNGDYDAVCLQELWSEGDFFRIREKVVDRLPYSHYYYSGFSGSGVCIFSKHQIVQTYFHKWVINGYAHKIQHGDWFGGKGVAMAVLKWKRYRLNVYSTHLHAEYNRLDDEYLPCRVVQAYETAQFVRLTSGNADVVILAGDLNTEPGDLPYRLLLNIPKLHDSFEKVQHDCCPGTVYTKHNSYTPKSLIKEDAPGQRIDHIMYKGRTVDVDVKKYEFPLPDRVLNQNYSYSDHEAICSTLAICDEKPLRKTSGDFIAEQQKALSESIDVLGQGLLTARKQRLFYLLVSVFLFAGLVVSLLFETNLNPLLNVFRFFVTMIMSYTLVMGTIGIQIEINAIYSCKLAMELYASGLE